MEFKTFIERVTRKVAEDFVAIAVVYAILTVVSMINPEGKGNE